MKRDCRSPGTSLPAGARVGGRVRSGGGERKGEEADGEPGGAGGAAIGEAVPSQVCASELRARDAVQQL